MKEIIRFWLLKRVIKNTELTAEIYQMLYKHKTYVRAFSPQPQLQPTWEFPKPVLSSVFVNPTDLPKLPLDRNTELMAALRELECKSIKTKQDKDSIGIIKATLKNVK